MDSTYEYRARVTYEYRARVWFQAIGRVMVISVWTTPDLAVQRLREKAEAMSMGMRFDIDHLWRQ